MDASELRGYWAANFRWVGGVPDATDICDRLMAGWQSPGRAYHTLQHLGECMELLTRWGYLHKAKHEIAVALWFHDFVYDPRATDNEDRSIDAARLMLGAEQIASPVIERIVQLITVTKHSSAAPQNENEQLLVDIDLAILGAAPGRFAQYCEQVRTEYSWVPFDVYREKRIAFLQSMVDRSKIFGLEAAALGRESAARRNIQNELGYLRGLGASAS
jgi:predicted metal-dependent HD superfamily phosphohydrolase